MKEVTGDGKYPLKWYVCHCDTAGIPRSLRVLSVLRWSGIPAVSTAYVGYTAGGVPATPVSFSYVPTTRDECARHDHFAAGQCRVRRTDTRDPARGR